MANAAEGGSGVRNTRTGTNSRVRHPGGRWSGLTEWSAQNLAAATTISSPSAPPAAPGPQPWGGGGPTNPLYEGAVYGGLTADQYKQQAEDIGPSTGGYYLNQENPAADERKAEETAKKIREKNRMGREAALPLGEWKPDVERMTWKEYNDLGPRQRAAIDYNTMLVQAVRKDLKMQDDYDQTPDEQKKYDSALEKMFGGEGRGSETYAPETLGVLRQLGYQDNSADIDDFLSLKTAITDKDLKDLPTIRGVPQAVAYSGQSPERTEQLGTERLLASSTAQIEKELAQSQQIQASISQVLAKERNYDIASLGGTKTKIDELGYGEAKVNPETGEPLDMNAFFLQSFDFLANSQSQDPTVRKKLIAEIDKRLATPENKELFWNYVDTRSSYAAKYDKPLGENENVDYLKANPFRAMLNLGGVR